MGHRKRSAGVGTADAIRACQVKRRNASGRQSQTFMVQFALPYSTEGLFRRRYLANHDGTGTTTYAISSLCWKNLHTQQFDVSGDSTFAEDSMRLNSQAFTKSGAGLEGKLPSQRVEVRVSSLAAKGSRRKRSSTRQPGRKLCSRIM